MKDPSILRFKAPLIEQTSVHTTSYTSSAGRSMKSNDVSSRLVPLLLAGGSKS